MTKTTESKSRKTDSSKRTKSKHVEPKVRGRSLESEDRKSRSLFARELLKQLQDVHESAQTIHFRTEIQLFKRKLAKGFKPFENSEPNFVSILALLEDALHNVKREKVDDSVLVIRKALEMCYSLQKIGYEEFQRVEELFFERDVDVLPEIDLSFLADDSDCDQEQNND